MTRATVGVISLSNSFLRYLRTSSARRRIAPLQLAGRLEDYLVKEFMQHVFYESKGSRFCETNFGIRSEQRIDIVFVRGRPGQEEVVEALIEAKYLHNRGHRSGTGHDKYDEIQPTLTSLRKQLDFRPGPHHRKRKVRIRAHTGGVYGLVFASYARKATEEDRKKQFFDKVLKTASELNLQYHDLPKPYLRSAYEDQDVTVFGEKWKVTLRGGLWRPKEETVGAASAVLSGAD